MKQSMVPVDLQSLRGNLGNHRLYTALRTEIDDLFHNFFGGTSAQTLTPTRGGLPDTDMDENFFFFPDIDVVETEKEISLSAELPGLTKEDIDINFNDGTLTIKGEKNIESDDEDETTHIVERRFGKFVRSYTLPRAIDADNIKADLENGVLTLTVPKIEDNVTKAHRILIK